MNSRVKYIEGVNYTSPVPLPAQHTDNLATTLLVQEQNGKQLVAENSDLLTGVVPGMAANVPFFPEEQQGPAVSFRAPSVGALLTCR